MLGAPMQVEKKNNTNSQDMAFSQCKAHQILISYITLAMITKTEKSFVAQFRIEGYKEYDDFLLCDSML